MRKYHSPVGATILYPWNCCRKVIPTGFCVLVRVLFLPKGCPYGTNSISFSSTTRKNSCGSVGLRMNIWCSAFQADFRCWSTPQNEFCGYENSAFQAKKHHQRQKSIAIEAFNPPPHLCRNNNRSRLVAKNNKRICLKGNNFHNRRSTTCGQRQHSPHCLKGRTIAAEVKISAPGKNKQDWIRNL